MSGEDSEVYLLDEVQKEWRKLDRGTSKWLKFSLIADSIANMVLAVLIVMTLVSILKIPDDAKVEVPVKLLLLLTAAAITVAALGRRKGFVVKEVKGND